MSSQSRMVCFLLAGICLFRWLPVAHGVRVKLKPTSQVEEQDLGPDPVEKRLWLELDKIMDEQDEVDAMVLADDSNASNPKGVYLADQDPKVREAVKIVYNLLRNHFDEREKGDVEAMLIVTFTQTAPLAFTGGVPHELKVTCEEALMLVWLMTKWRVDSIISLGMGMSDSEQRKVLEPILDCKVNPDEQTCSILKRFREEVVEYKGHTGAKCPIEFSGAEEEHKALFTEYVEQQIEGRHADIRGLHDVDASVQPPGEDSEDVLVDDETLEKQIKEQFDADLAEFDALESEPVTPNEVEEDLGAMVLSRVQHLNADRVAIRCAKRRLMQVKGLEVPTDPPTPTPEENEECLQFLQDIVAKSMAAQQRASKCCCTPADECSWKLPGELTTSWYPFDLLKKKCPKEAPNEKVDAGEVEQACGPFEVLKHLDALRTSMLQTRSNTSEEQTAGYVNAYIAEMEQLGRTEDAIEHLDQLETDVAWETERVVDSSPFAREHVEWFEACRVGIQVHKVRGGGEKELTDSKQCGAPDVNGPVMACPTTMDTYCYDKKAAYQGRCCCNSVKVTGGTFGKTKYGQGQCASELKWAEDARLARMQKAQRERAEQERRDQILKEQEERKAAEAKGELSRAQIKKGNLKDGMTALELEWKKSSFYEPCASLRVHKISGNKCKTSKIGNKNCPMRVAANMINVNDMTPYCYHDYVDRYCCCRERHIDGKGSNKKGTDACGIDWPTERPDSEVYAPGDGKKKKGFWKNMWGANGGEPEDRQVIVQFNDIFHDQQLRKAYKGEEKWGKNDKKWAKKFMKKVEGILEELQKEMKTGKMWTCDDAANQTCQLLSKGKLRRYMARINHLTEKIHRLFSRNDALGRGNPKSFGEVVSCAESVLGQYRERKDGPGVEYKALDTTARKVARDFTHLNIASPGGFWHHVGKATGVVFRTVSSVVGGVLYLLAVPGVLINEGVMSVQNSGQLWRFPIGFLFRGPVISLFGKSHFQWWGGDFQTSEEDGFFRWGVWGAATRAFRLFRRTTTEELVEQVPDAMRLLVQLHRMLNIADQCGDTVQMAK